MRLAQCIDAACRRRAAGPPAVETVTPALIRFYDREARALRAEAQAMVLRGLLRAPLAALHALLLLLSPAGAEAARPRR